MSVDIAREVKKLENKKEEWRSAVLSSREMILSNLAMISQIPAPTFEEKNRSEFLIERFSECGFAEPETDEMYNVSGMLYGSTGERNILITTHMDNQFDQFVDQNISISEHKVFGAGAPEDNLALAVICTLPDIFAKAGFALKSKLSFLATTRFHEELQGETRFRHKPFRNNPGAARLFHIEPHTLRHNRRARQFLRESVAERERQQHHHRGQRDNQFDTENPASQEA